MVYEDPNQKTQEPKLAYRADSMVLPGTPSEIDDLDDEQQVIAGPNLEHEIRANAEMDAHDLQAAAVTNLFEGGQPVQHIQEATPIAQSVSQSELVVEKKPLAFETPAPKIQAESAPAPAMQVETLTTPEPTPAIPVPTEMTAVQNLEQSQTNEVAGPAVELDPSNVVELQPRIPVQASQLPASAEATIEPTEQSQTAPPAKVVSLSEHAQAKGAPQIYDHASADEVNKFAEHVKKLREAQAA